MANILVTGGSGFLGKAFVRRMVEKGETVYCLSRHPLPGERKLIGLRGDILEYDLGLDEVPENITAVYHLAANHRLDDKNASEIWNTNVQGTSNTILFCLKYDISKLYFVSTAYTFGRNTYEKSKALCESMVINSPIPHKTIFKPSIIMPSDNQLCFDHLLLFAKMIVRIHRKAEAIRRYLETGLRLPELRPVFRAPGNPDGRLNLINIEDVASAMATIDTDGVYWLVNPMAPSLKDIAEWIGDVILVDFKIVPEFKEMPLEVIFQRMAKAFLPYLWGDDFKSNINCRPISKEYIHKVVANSVLGEEKL